jgi:hypothetical protein
MRGSHYLSEALSLLSCRNNCIFFMVMTWNFEGCCRKQPFGIEFRTLNGNEWQLDYIYVFLCFSVIRSFSVYKSEILNRVVRMVQDVLVWSATVDFSYSSPSYRLVFVPDVVWSLWTHFFQLHTKSEISSLLQRPVWHVSLVFIHH